MRLIVLTLSIAAFTGCSGTAKRDEAPKAPPPANTETAAVPANPGPSRSSIICKRAGETRTLHIDKLQPKGCKLLYSNHSATEPVASSVHGTDHCDKVSARIQDNISKIGFNCGADGSSP